MTSDQDYLDSIGPAENYDEMICTQKQNVWRQGSAGTSGRGYNKHIPCPWSKIGLFNFKHDSVEAPSFALTDEEIGEARRILSNELTMTISTSNILLIGCEGDEDKELYKKLYEKGLKQYKNVK